MTLELSMYFLSGVLFVVCCLIGVIWNQKNAEIKEHSRLLELKAGHDRLNELDSRFDKELHSMRDNNEKLIEKLERRHDKDLESVSTGFREQINGMREQMVKMESNIMRHMELLFNNSKNN